MRETLYGPAVFKKKSTFKYYIVQIFNDICFYIWCKFFYSLKLSWIKEYVQQVKKKNTPIYFNTNYRMEMKLVPIIMDYCLLQFDALIFFFGVRLHGGSLPNFNFFNVNPQFFQLNRKVHLSNCLETNFHNISNIGLRIIRRRDYS